MSTRLRTVLRALLPTLALLALGAQAGANTLTQNVSWTIDRAGTSTKYRVVAYGDSIYAGYNGSVFNAAKYAAPTVDARVPLGSCGTPTSRASGARKSGAVASDIYNNKIVAERSYMQASRHARRHLRDVRQRRAAGALELQEPDGHLQLRRPRRRA